MNELAPKPKIFIFSTAYLPMIGGAELAIKEITDRLADDFDFVLLTTRLKRSLPKCERIGRVQIRRFGSGLLPYLDKALSPFLAAYFVYKFMKKHPVHLFWSMMVTFTSGAPFILKFLGLDKNVPILLSLQEGDTEDHLRSANLGLTGLAWKLAAPRATKVQTISFYLKKLAVKFGVNLAETEVVPNGVDLENFSRRLQPDRVKELRIRLGLPTGKPIIITASRLVRKNGIDILIKSLADIPEARLLIAGAGPQEKELRNLARKLKKEKMIHWLGSVNHKKLAEFLAISHVFARPSRSEGLGSAFLEAMASGLAVVATNVGGIPDFLIHQKTGLFCKTEDPEDLAFQIRLLLYNRELRENIASAGQKLVFQNYSWDKVAGSMRQIFLRLLK
ncbi:MAG: glycosyltransferase family 4 protein [Patescibacteria group bacterium]